MVHLCRLKCRHEACGIRGRLDAHRCDRPQMKVVAERGNVSTCAMYVWQHHGLLLGDGALLVEVQILHFAQCRKGVSHT